MGLKATSYHRCQEKSPDSGICRIGGVPTLMGGGLPLAAPAFCLFYDQALRDEVVASLHENGIGTFAVRSMIGVGDCRQTDESVELAVKRLRNVAKVAPGARLMADCLFFPSEEWLIENPQECFITADGRILVLGRNGESNRRDYVRVPGPSIADVKTKEINGESPRIIFGCRRVSPFSEAFAREACRAVGKILTSLRENGIGGHVSGFFIGCYIHGEWNLHMTSPDHSGAAVQFFRRHLRVKYGNDLSLQAAWGSPGTNLKNALPPIEYSKTNLAPMITATRREADYREAEAKALARQFSIIANGIKKLFPNVNVGGFFPGANPPQSEWLKLADDPSIDFLATPIAYENRSSGCGVSSQSPFCDGFPARGKVWFDELDTRTIDARKEIHYPYGRAKTVRESLELLWRDAGQMLVRGHSGWWLDFGNDGAPPYSWHLRPEILRFHREFSAIWKRLPELDRRPFGEIKVFMPSNAARYHQVLHHADNQRHVEWTLLGAPVECEVLENLLQGKTDPGKLNIIHGAGCLSSESLRRLDNIFRRSRSFVIWMGGAGLCKEGLPVDGNRIVDSIPIRQRFSILKEPLEAEAISTREALTHLGLQENSRMGQYVRKLTSGFVSGPGDLNVPMKRIAVNWKLEVDDPDAIPLACLPSDGSVVAAMKEDSDGTAHVAYNLPILSTALLRAIAQKAGCHLFTLTDDVVYASQGLLLLHAVYSGNHRLCFPGDVRVFDLRKKKELSARGSQLTLRLKCGETVLYSYHKV